MLIYNCCLLSIIGVLLYSYLNDIDFDKPQESRGIATIICPRFNQTLYNCTFGLSNDKCISDGSHAVISCINCRYCKINYDYF